MRHLSSPAAVLALTVCSQCGCQFMPHALQPRQLWKMNRQPAMDVRFQSPEEWIEHPKQTVAHRVASGSRGSPWTYLPPDHKSYDPAQFPSR